MVRECVEKKPLHGIKQSNIAADATEVMESILTDAGCKKEQVD